MLLPLVALSGAAGAATGQQTVSRSGGPDLLLVASDPSQALAGGSLWWRVAPRTRVGGLLAGGSSGREVALRGEVAGHFLLHPNRSRGVAFYVGGGLAAVGGRAREERLLVLAGVEASPAARRGWVLEMGLGGGLRLAAGRRWRASRGRSR